MFIAIEINVMQALLFSFDENDNLILHNSTIFFQYMKIFGKISYLSLFTNVAQQKYKKVQCLIQSAIC